MRIRPTWTWALVAVAFSFVVRPAYAGVEPAAARRGMVASTRPLASEVGAQILARGGNAADAAVAVALALAVTWPSAGNLGGGGFLLIRRADGTAEVIDYRERAPLAATRDMFLDAEGKVVPEASTYTHRAVGVPGTVAGLALALQRHGSGKLKWAELIEPARRLAAEGFAVDRQLALSLQKAAKQLGKTEEARRIFLRDGQPYQVGDRLLQRDLAATLARLKQKGPREFYEGETARRLVEDMKVNGGLVTARDLKDYEPAIRQPLRGTYRGYEILTMPPPSSGGIILLEALNILEQRELAPLGHNSANAIHLLVESLRRAFADRGALLGDADFVKVPVTGLISKDYARGRGRDIDPARVTPSSAVKAGDPLPFEKPETTHFTIVDAQGNAVSNTYTLNGSYGTALVAKGTGVLLNNEMDDFAASPTSPNMFGLIQGEANAIAPKKRPLSTMTPAIVLKDGKLLLAIGSPGGPTIVSTVLQVIVNTIDFGMNLQQAIAAPRVHHQYLPDVVYVEPFGISKETRAELEARGHVLKLHPLLPYLGDAQGIGVEPGTGLRLGASDPRMGGAPAGY